MAVRGFAQKRIGMWALLAPSLPLLLLQLLRAIVVAKPPLFTPHMCTSTSSSFPRHQQWVLVVLPPHVGSPPPSLYTRAHWGMEQQPGPTSVRSPAPAFPPLLQA